LVTRNTAAGSAYPILIGPARCERNSARREGREGALPDPKKRELGVWYSARLGGWGLRSVSTCGAGVSSPRMSHTSVVLRAEQVSKHFGAVKALDGISLDVCRGECVALIGESGSGKSTLLRCFNRLTDPDSGRVFIDGADAASLDPIALRRRIGYVPQEGGLLPHWRVRRNVALVPWLQSQADATERAERALILVGLDTAGLADRWPADLSGGQRQRVAVARALAAEPSVILLDEPFGALDAITRADLQNTFRRLRDALEITALLVTHDLQEAVLLADRIAVVREGRLEQFAPPSELVRSPDTDYVRELLRRARAIE
jgi:osmoprotectant transport system ATP-binding protein